MEIRCGSCNKLFRVSDDKITGTGIKFPCTRCGVYVKITKEDFEHYTLSRKAVSALDMFEPKPKPAKTPQPTDATGPVVKETAPSAAETMTFDLAAPSTHETTTQQDEMKGPAPIFVEPAPVVASAPVPAAGPGPAVEHRPGPVSAPESKSGSFVEPKPGPQPESVFEAKPLSAPQPEAMPALKSEPRAKPVTPTPPVAPLSTPVAQPAMPKKEAARPAAPLVLPAMERTVKEPPPPPAHSYSGRMMLVLLVSLIIAGLASYGVFIYLHSSSQKGKETAPEILSTEGLRISNSAGSVEANGDLLVTGVIENAMDTEKTAWYVVVEVYDAQGTVLSKIRLLNGKQLYTRRDYDILAKRGANVQELKAKNLQEKGVSIPPKGTVSFELRYLQPPVGIASFNALVLPFDPVQLYKEIAGEIEER